MENSTDSFGENGGLQGGSYRSNGTNSPPSKNHRGKSPSRGQRKKSMAALLSTSQSSENISLGGSFNHSSSSSGHMNNLRVQSITHKKELIAAARRVNPAMTNSAPAVFWSTEECLKNASIDTTGAQQQLNIVENGVNSTAKRLNDLRIQNERATLVLKSKLDELELCKKDFENLDAMSRAETHDAARIKQLQEDCAAVTKVISDKIHYTRRLEHMLLRLQTNQLKFDAHMNGMEDTAKAIEREYAEVRILRRNLDVGLGKAQSILEETQSNLSLARRERDLLLTQRQQEFRNAQMLSLRMKEREESRLRLVAELKGGLDAEEESVLEQELAMQLNNTQDMKKNLEDRKKFYAMLENSFLQLSQITGVSTFEQMMEKFSLMQLNRGSLEKDKQSAEDKLLATKRKALDLEKKFQELRSEGVKGQHAELNREEAEGLEDLLSQARSEVKLLATIAERLETVSIGLEQAGVSLQQRVEHYTHILDEDVFKLTQTDEELPWTKTLDTLNMAEQIFVKMVEAYSMGDQHAPASSRHTKSSKDPFDEDEEDEEEEKEVEEEDEFPSPFDGMDSLSSNNIRIYTRKERLQNEAEEPMTHHLTINSRKEALLAEENKLASMFVPNRVEVKKKSAMNAANALKKIEQEVRNKALASRLHEGHADTGEARLRAQTIYSEKLTQVTGHNMSLPEGITLKDDVMKRIAGFIDTKAEDILE